MSVGRADGLGGSIGQPGRIDQASEAYQDRLRVGVRLEIPEASVDRTRSGAGEGSPSGPGAGPGSGSGWSAAERFHDERGGLWARRQLGKWDGFAGGQQKGQRRSASEQGEGSIVIDGSGVHSAVLSAQVAEGRQQADLAMSRGWSAMRRAHRHAARFEEYSQESVLPMLGGEPGHAAPKRRSFRVDD